MQDSRNNPSEFAVINTRAPLTPAASPIYFGAAAHWVDVYHFRYTVSNFTSRTLVFHLNNTQASVFSQVAWGTTGPWAPWSRTVIPSATDLVIGVVDAVPLTVQVVPPGIVVEPLTV